MGDSAQIDHVAKALCRSFYEGGTIYEQSVERVVESRWREWRPQAEAAITAVSGWSLGPESCMPEDAALLRSLADEIEQLRDGGVFDGGAKGDETNEVF